MLKKRPRTSRFLGDDTQPSFEHERGMLGGFPAAAPSRPPRNEAEAKEAIDAQKKRQVARVKTVQQLMAEQRHNYRRTLARIRHLDAPLKRLRLAKLEKELLRREAEEAKAEG